MAAGQRAGAGLASVAPDWDDGPACRLLAESLAELPETLSVVISDLGCAMPGLPSQRCPVTPGRDGSLPVATLGYRSLELCLGDQNFSFPVDIWSFGCVLFELLRKQPFFDGPLEVQVECMIRLCTPPAAPGLSELEAMPGWVHLPRPRSSLLADAAKDPRQALADKECDLSLLDLVQGALTVLPSRRLTVADAVRISNSFKPSLRCVVSAQPAGRGAFTLVSGTLDRKLTNWLRADPFWKELVGSEPPRKRRRQFSNSRAGGM